MSMTRSLNRFLEHAPKWLKVFLDFLFRVLPLEKVAKKIPLVQSQLQAEYEKMLDGIRKDIKPYNDKFPRNFQLPKSGIPKDELLMMLNGLTQGEKESWQNGFVSGGVYHGGKEHIEFMNSVYALFSQANPLHADIWPSIHKFEAEVISMTGRFLGGGRETSKNVCGSFSSGGTESILLAMKAYRDFAFHEQGIKNPEIIVPETAHAAFDKACQFFNITKRMIPVDNMMRADVKEAKKAVNRNTIAIVGSAPSFPHGTLDPIKELSDLALEHQIGFHTDACLGGFVLAFAPKEYNIPEFDFRLPGVTSISCDTHKFGYANKGSSVILYSNQKLRQYQYFTATDWPGGLYFSPTFAGSRSGALSAQAWASMLSIGEEGYRKASEKILSTAAFLKSEMGKIPGLKILGEPLWVIAFAAEKKNIYEVLDFMKSRHWNLNGLHRPSCVHLCVTLLHTQEGVAERFLQDLSEGFAQSSATSSDVMAPVYGLASSLPMRGMVDDLLKMYMDVLYEP